MSVPSTTANPMKIGFGVFWEIKVKDDVDALNINTSGEKVRADQTSAGSLSEVMEDFISIDLGHFGVNKEATMAEIGNVFGQKLYSSSGITEDYSLVDG